MRCLETRRTPEGYKKRRYRADSGVRHTTIEVPIEAWVALNGQGRGNDRTAARARALAREELHARVVALHAQGWKPEAISNETLAPTRSVQRWIQKYAR